VYTMEVGPADVDGNAIVGHHAQKFIVERLAVADGGTNEVASLAHLAKRGPQKLVKNVGVVALAICGKATGDAFSQAWLLVEGLASSMDMRTYPGGGVRAICQHVLKGTE
jgi:hypothetical protein